MRTNRTDPPLRTALQNERVQLCTLSLLSNDLKYKMEHSDGAEPKPIRNQNSKIKPNQRQENLPNFLRLPSLGIFCEFYNFFGISYHFLCLHSDTLSLPHYPGTWLCDRRDVAMYMRQTRCDVTGFHARAVRVTQTSRISALADLL